MMPWRQDTVLAQLRKQLSETNKLYQQVSESPLASLAKQISQANRSYLDMVSAPQAALKELNDSLRSWRELRSELFAPRWDATLRVLPALTLLPIQNLSQDVAKPLGVLLTTQQPFEALLAPTEPLQSAYKLSISLRQQVLNRYAIELFRPVGPGRAEYRDQLDSEVEEIEGRVEEDLDGLLQAIDPNLVQILRGVRERARNKGTDWVRQTLTSLRELSTHVLHLLAPDERVEACGLLDSCAPEIREKDGRGKPTRSARLYTIYFGIQHVEMREFLKADVKAALSLFDLLNAGTHRMSSALTEREVTSILRKVESTLQFLIESSE